MRGETFVTRKDHPRPGAHQGRPAAEALSRQPRCQTRLGPCPRLRRDAVADAAAGAAAPTTSSPPGQHSVRDLSHGCGMSRHRPRPGREPASKSRPSTSTARCIVAVDPRYFRPTEVETLLGDASKARKELGWAPRTDFRTLVEEMVTEDLKPPSATPWSPSMATPHTTSTNPNRSHTAMQKDSRIYVAGHRGLVGSAIRRELKRRALITSSCARTQSSISPTRSPSHASSNANVPTTSSSPRPR